MMAGAPSFLFNLESLFLVLLPGMVPNEEPRNSTISFLQNVVRTAKD